VSKGPDANEVLEAIIAGNKAKADNKKAKKPGRMDAMKMRKSAPRKDADKSTTSSENDLKKDDSSATGAHPLKDRKEIFCQAYIGKANLNATEAALMAGYSQKSARNIGSENMAKPDIRARIAFLQRATMKKLEVTPERIMAEVAKVAFASLGDFIKVQSDGTGYIDLKDVTPEMFAALESYEVTELPPFKTVENGEEVVREVLKIKVKLSPKLDALEKLMRRHNLVKPMEVNHNHSGKVAFELPDLARRTAFLLAKAAKMNDTKPEGVQNAPDTQAIVPSG
jgi:phage terminase small subunit